jgi:DNA repair photolyase
MIISASYKTDIPTFYGEWFMNRLEAGYCKMVNPYNQRISRVDLTPASVDGFVFWTKNIGPFLKYLPDISSRGYHFIVQHTINSYPRELEYKVINSAHTIEHMKTLADQYGPNVAIWRYDPIIISSVTPVDEHRRNFEQLAQALEGTTNEVVVSFAQIYKKTKRNMDNAARKLNFSWHEHETMQDEETRQLIIGLAEIAQCYRMQLKVCSQKAYLIPGIIEEARCVDADRLEKVSHKKIQDREKQRGNRKECGCFASKDIGEYDTCPHGCVYCYAVQNRDLALERYKSHDPVSEFLFPPKAYIPIEEEAADTPQIIPTANIHKRNGVNKLTQGELF